MKMRKKGISDIVSTVILVSALLLISIAVMFIANDVFSIQNEDTEFEQAKNIMVNFAGIIEDVSGKQGASGYVRFNPVSGGPYFQHDLGNILIQVDNGTNSSLIYNSTYNAFKYRGGGLVGVSGKEMLRGTDNLIVVNNAYPLGSVYVEQSSGAWIVLNYTKIGVLNLGVFNFTEGVDENGSPIFEPLNVLEIHYIELVPGSFTGSGSIYAVATCKNISVTYHRIDSSNGIINFTIQIPTGSETTAINVNSHYNTVIIFVKSVVQIDMFGG